MENTYRVARKCMALGTLYAEWELRYCINCTLHLALHKLSKPASDLQELEDRRTQLIRDKQNRGPSISIKSLER